MASVGRPCEPESAAWVPLEQPALPGMASSQAQETAPAQRAESGGPGFARGNVEGQIATGECARDVVFVIKDVSSFRVRVTSVMQVTVLHHWLPEPSVESPRASVLSTPVK
jgi:hypothetical protein